jgi:phage baseplate assembly protein V
MVAGMADPADTQRLIGDIARLGTVASVDLAAGTAQVDVGELRTGDIPWLTFRAGATRTWSPPSVGEQVLVLSPEADTAAGLIVGGLSSDAHPAPASDGSMLVQYQDGASIGYDPERHALTAKLPAGATVLIEAEGGLHFTGDLTVDGDIRSTGTVTADGDVKAGTVSLKTHRHTAVQTGGGISGPPQP